MENTSLLGIRLKFARERARLTQAQLAKALGLDHRQSLAAIEAGERRMSAQELLRAVQVLGADLDFFTDAFRLVGEGRFSFRATPGLAGHILDQFEERAGRWIATYREIGHQQGDAPAWLEPKLALSPRSTFEEAQAAAESLGEKWKLGDCPADSLPAAVERELDALVLYVDAPAGISGAASQVPRLNVVLVNRLEPEGRRNFDLAHEVFHLLTWDVMPPERIESVDVPRGGKAKRVEQLAESFAAALLMPERVVQARWSNRLDAQDIHAWLNETATDLRVSAKALLWRVVNLGFIGKADQFDINKEFLVANGRSSLDAPAAALFSARFVRRIAGALDDGRLSVKRAAALLGVSVSGLAELLREYDIEPSFEA